MKVFLIALLALAVTCYSVNGQGRQSFYLGKATVPTTEFFVPANRQGSCATKFKNFYLSKNFLTDWMGAYAFCKGVNMKLVALRDQNEWQQFAQLVVNGASNLNGAANIGASRGNNNSWVWFDNGQRIEYALPWPARQHSNEVINKGDCLEVAVNNGKLTVNDKKCTGGSGQFICETSYRYNCIYW